MMKINSTLARLAAGILAATVTVTSMLPAMPISAADKPTYDVDKALKYAEEHWDDGVGLCAEFASNVLRAGGISMSVEKGTGGCMRGAEAGSGLTRTELKLTPDDGSKTAEMATKADNAGILAAGDLVIQYCKTHEVAPHVLICTGYDKDGIAVFAAHNGAMYNKRYRLGLSTAYQHTKDCDMTGLVVHVSSLDVADHTHSYNNVGKCTVCSESFEIVENAQSFTAKVTKAVALKSAPYSASKAGVNVKKGDSVKIIASATNHYGNLWYKTESGWIYSENVKKTACSHEYNSVGVCKVCGTAYAYKVQKLDQPALLLKQIDMKSSPYSASNITRTVKTLSFIHIVGTTANHYGNTWYITSEGDWIYCENIYLLPGSLTKTVFG